VCREGDKSRAEAHSPNSNPPILIGSSLSLFKRMMRGLLGSLSKATPVGEDCNRFFPWRRLSLIEERNAARPGGRALPQPKRRGNYAMSRMAFLTFCRSSAVSA